MIDKVKSILQELNVEGNIISIFKTGGHLFCENCKDIDYKIIVDNPKLKRTTYHDNETSIDYIFCSLTEREKELNFETNKKLNIYIIEELFKPTTTVYGDSSVNLDLLGNKGKYIELLRKTLPKSYLNPIIKWENSDKYCNRHLWWVIVGLKFIENKSYVIDDELKSIIQQCHDGVLPKQWENWVREKIK